MSLINKIESKLELSFIQILINRIKSESPELYVTIRWMSGLAIIVCMVLWAVGSANPFPFVTAHTSDIITASCATVGKFLCGVWSLSWTGTKDLSLILNKDEIQKLFPSKDSPKE